MANLMRFAPKANHGNELRVDFLRDPKIILEMLFAYEQTGVKKQLLNGSYWGLSLSLCASYLETVNVIESLLK